MSSRDDDDRTWKLTYDGTRGVAFRQFKRDFFALARGRFAKDDRYSFFQAYIRMDEGGTGNNAPTLPAQNGGAGGGVNPAYTAATTKRAIRMGQAYSFLYDSITDDRILDMLADLSEQNPNELAGEAWSLIVRECDVPDDDLELNTMNREWENTTVLNSVGYNLSTITDFSRHLNTLNAKRPQARRINENDKTAKFLACITYPESLGENGVRL